MAGLLLAAQQPPPDWIVPLVIMFVAAAAIFCGIVTLFMKQYKRCPSNRILVIYGKTTTGRRFECIHGGARLVIPLFQDFGWLSLEPIEIEITLTGVPSKDDVRVNVPGVFTVAIGTTPELMHTAAERVLGLGGSEIKRQAEDIISPRFCQVIASMGIEELSRDRQALVARIQKPLETDLRQIGLVLINVAIADITDESGQIEAEEKATIMSLLRRLLKEKLSDEDRAEIRRFLDAPDSAP